MNREPVTPTVQITIKNGIAEVFRKDLGVRLIIVDKDGEQVGQGIEEHWYPSWNQIGKKPRGRRYTRFVDIS